MLFLFLFSFLFLLLFLFLVFIFYFLFFNLRVTYAEIQMKFTSVNINPAQDFQIGKPKNQFGGLVQTDIH